MRHDLRWALLSLRRNPGFTALAVLTLAVGIGATTAVFSVVQAIVLRPLPYDEPDRLVDVSHVTKEGRRMLTSWFDLRDLRAEEAVFEDVAARSAGVWDALVELPGGEPVAVPSLDVTYNYFSVLGVEPTVGRSFVPDDDDVEYQEEAGADPAEEGDAPRPAEPILITHGLWQRMFGGEPEIDGLRLYLRGSPLKVVGVLPADFRLLHERQHRWVRGTSAELFFLVSERDLQGARPSGGQGRSALLLGRLRDGVSYERAQAGVDAVAARLREEIPAYAEDQLTLPLYPLHDDLTERSRSLVFVLAGGVVFLMLLVCANVASLMLVRGWTRSGEDAMRAVLGCGRLRLLLQRLLECSLIGAAGAVVGVGLAWSVVRLVGRLAPPTVPLMDRVALDGWTVLFAVAAAAFAVVAFGLLPAISTGRVQLASRLRTDARGGGGRRQRRLMRTLVVGELAVSTVLLAGALLMVRSMHRLADAGPGFDASGLVSFDIAPVDDERRNFATWLDIVTRLEERLQALPGVEGVGRTSAAPLSERVMNRNYGWTVDVLASQAHRAEITTVSDGYFGAMRTPLLEGRAFEPGDAERDEPVAIVDEVLAAKAWPGQSAVGRRIRHQIFDEGAVVVGVVSSVLTRDLGTGPREVIYHPDGVVNLAATFLVRTAMEPGALVPAVREVVREVAPGLAPYGVQDMAARVRVSQAPTRFLLFTTLVLAGVALLIAAGGLFGVVSYTVRTQRGELGIRMAIGADRATIRWMVLGRAAAMTAAGLAIGVASTALLSRVLRSVAYEVSPTDPLLLGATALVLGSVAMAACYAPAAWASRVEPARVLGP